MYDENSMKSHIFWIKVRRIFLLLLFTALGTALGVIISDYLVNILLFQSHFRPIIIVASAVIFLGLALLLTAHTGKEIEDGYWKIAVYKKLAIISKKLEKLEKLDNLDKISDLKELFPKVKETPSDIKNIQKQDNIFEESKSILGEKNLESVVGEENKLNKLTNEIDDKKDIIENPNNL